MQKRAHDVFVLEHQGRGKDQVRQSGGIIHKRIHHNFKINRFKRLYGLPRIRRLVDNIGTIHPDHPDRRILSGCYFPADNGKLERSAAFCVNFRPVHIQIAVRMQLVITPAPCASDIAGEQGQRVNKSDIFTPIAIALQAGTHQGGGRFMGRIKRKYVFYIRRFHITDSRQLFHRFF